MNFRIHFNIIFPSIVISHVVFCLQVFRSIPCVTCVFHVQSYIGPEDFRILRQYALESDKVVSPTHRPSLPPEKIPDTHFCYRLSRPESTARPNELIPRKISKTSSGIEPATFQLVKQHFNVLHVKPF